MPFRRPSAAPPFFGALVLSAALAGCYLSHERLAPVEDDFGETDAYGCTPSPDGAPPARPGVPPLDLLFVVDDSGSMAEEQRALQASFGRMVGWLVTGDLDDDGDLEFPPIEDLHVGVVSTDLGVRIPAYCPSSVGGGGELVAGRSDCEGAATRPFLSLAPGEDPAGLSERFGCLAHLGTRGCALEQPLEAALLALTDSDVRLSTSDPSLAPRGDGANAGFLREGSVLAIVVVTDEDDASIADAALYVTLGALDARARASAELAGSHPIGRYVEGFDRLRTDPRALSVSIVAGVPEDLVGQSPDRILADPRLARVPAEDDGVGLATSCSGGAGSAYPPRRLLGLASSLGERASVHSLCTADFARVARGLATQLGWTVRRVRCDE